MMLLLLGCPAPVDPGCKGAWYADADGDGFGAGAPVDACEAPAGHVPHDGDCDDGDAARFPGAPERCDADLDCDGLAGEPTSVDALDAWVDADADGYGDPARATRTCVLAAPWTGNGDDCDDRAPDVFPGAPEACAPAGRDEDCDGAVDDLDTLGADSPGAWPWYADLDDDGFGGDAAWSCLPPEGTTPVPGDCDEARPDVYPGAPEPDCAGGVDFDCDGAAVDDDRDADGATACDDCDDADPGTGPDAEETCDGLDNNCDGAADEGLERVKLYADADGDGYGNAGASLDWCGPLDGYVEDDTDCNDSSRRSRPGGTEECYDGLDNDCDGATDDENAVGCLTYRVDADGDGYAAEDADAACLCEASGAYTTWWDTWDCDDTTAAVGPAATETAGDGLDANCDGIDGDGADTLRRFAAGPDEDDLLGSAGLAVGDLDGDGDDDVAVGVPGRDAVGRDDGEVWLLAGPYDGGYDAPTTRLYAADGSGGALGTGLATADLDSDGYLDLLVASPDAASNGRVTAHLGPLTGDTRDDAAAWLVVSAPSGTYNFGGAVTHADLTGDGTADLVVGQPRSGSRYSAEVFVLPADATADPASPLVTLRGSASDSGLGEALDAARDLDGDGLADLVTGGASAGLYYGPLSGTYTVRDADATFVVGDGGQVENARSTPDLDGDGLADLLVVGWDTGAKETSGVLLHAGPMSGERGADDAFAVVHWAGSDPTRMVSAAPADLDGDGETDLVLGCASSARVVLGPFAGTAALRDVTTAGWVTDTSVGTVHAGTLDGEEVAWIFDGAASGVPDAAGVLWLLSGDDLP